MSRSYRFAIDRGGTFTDVVAQTPSGQMVTTKLLSHDPAHYPDAASEAVARIVADHGPAPIAEVRIGTTIATNALLEREGAPVALAITCGFGDALQIGNQARPDIFARHIVLPERLESDVVEIAERIGADGAVLRALDEAAARRELARLRAAGITALAIVLLHGWKYPAHEARLAAIAQDLGFTQISTSHEVSPTIRLIPRGDTTVVDAYLSPVLRAYIAQLTQRLPQSGALRFMQSNGGLAQASSFRGKDAILSGPAGGVVGMVATGKALGHDRLIGFDMGGTSTDVAHYAGEYERTGDSVVAGIRVAAPMMQIHTVAAGGGSICRFDGTRLRVGPQSAGAHPGPACYRKGGPLTLTDCNLVLGRVDPAHFPSLFGPSADQPLDPVAARARLEEVAACLPTTMSAAELAEGFLAIAVDSMANAIRKISTARGHDVSSYALSCFGGAGGQFACRVADELGIPTVLVHPLAGMLSAYGIGLAPLVAMREASVVQPLKDSFAKQMGQLHSEARTALIDQGIAPDQIELITRLRLRFSGSDTTLDVPLEPTEQAERNFRAEHRARFGWSDETAAIVLEAISVEAIGTSGGLQISADQITSATPDDAILVGPAMIPERGTTTVIEKGWSARRAQDGSMVISRGSTDVASGTDWASGTDMASGIASAKHQESIAPDPVRLEIFNNAFMAIAEEMGVVLEATASSVNIKERLDFSCALFDAGGALIANAPHIPVHLGSMGASIRRIISQRGSAADGPQDGRGIRRGDAYCLNDPYHGGTHLPDVTVIVPVFYNAASRQPDAFVAARGHHADIGGIAPGSMPPGSTSIDQEGIRLDNVLLVENGHLREAAMRDLLAQGRFPARNPDQNIADLEAQLAACSRGADLLVTAAADHGSPVLAAYMGHVLDNGEAAVRRLLETLPQGSFAYAMDNGAQIAVSICIDRQARSAQFDFAGTSAQQADNFNAPVAITRAAVLYALRCLIDDTIPLNDGCLRPIALRIPPGSMLDPAPPAAIVAGNVETSQVITDAILAATGQLAPSQGTMNNFTFGDATRQYYETIAGGSGAGPRHNGTDAVQTHMTNSRLTDPEVLETRLPVRLDSFARRTRSGGQGAFCGGEGVERRIAFLEPMTAQILANRRRIAPRGIAGGTDAAPGENWIERTDGSVETLAATGAAAMQPGDIFVIRTPGGAGFGSDFGHSEQEG